MDRDETLTPAAFEALLSWLDADRDQAGKKFEAIRTRLILFFRCRGCADAEDLTDVTMDRVTKKAQLIVKDYEGEPALYFYGVARNVIHEANRKRVPIVLPPPVNKSDDFEQELECLDRCMLQLTTKNRELVLEYYQNEKRAKIEHRRALAEKFGIAQNALRIRAHRIRMTLQRCFFHCVEQLETT